MVSLSYDPVVSPAQAAKVTGLIVMPEVPVERLLQVPSMLIRMPCSLRTPVKASLVNWAP